MTATALAGAACIPPDGGPGTTVPNPNLAPIAVLGAAPTSGGAPLLVAFDSAGSSDADGTIDSISWDFGDGSPVETGAAVSHSYTDEGSFTATLTVTDDDGATDTETTTIEVTAPADVAPVAVLGASTTSGIAHLAVDFDATGSSDADGTIVGYAWDFGDGNTSTDAAPNHLYTVAGSYDVELTITDDDGLTANATTTVTATDGADARYVASTGSDVGGCQASATPCQTVQYAVNQADAAGDTVFVGSGTYPELVTLAKDLDFKGANQGQRAGVDAEPRRAESTVKGIRTITGTSTPGNQQRNITIDGMAISPQGDTTLISVANRALVWLLGGASNVVENTVFDGGNWVPTCSSTCTTMPDNALEVRSGGVEVRNNSFTNFRRTANFYQTGPTGVLFTDVSYTGNVMTHYTSRGLQIAPSGGNKSVSGVTVDGNLFDATGYGAGSSPGSIVVTTGANTYTNNTFVGSSSGIYLYLCTSTAYVVGPQTIVGNTFTGNGSAVSVYAETPVGCTVGNLDGSQVHDNDLSGNTNGFSFSTGAAYFADGRGPIDVTCNWWGAATGPNTPGASNASTLSEVVTSPWQTALGGACDGA
ncbi:MAG: PKD domain-containing protein [Microthrixaceae bacterium]